MSTPSTARGQVGAGCAAAHPAAIIFLGAAVVCALLLRPRADQRGRLGTGRSSCRLTGATTVAVG